MKEIHFHASYGRKREGKLSLFIKDINNMLAKGLMGSVIEKKIRKSGYQGSSSTIRRYIADWKRRRKFYHDKSQEKGVKTVTVERKDIFKLLYHPIEKVKTISQEFFERICSENPCFRKIHNIIWGFKKILIDKDVGGLKKWMDKAQDLQIPEISSFVNGLNRDFDAVRNSIKYEYNNGLAEKSVNKLKVIKRIMYGRCNFETLRIKTLRLEKMHSIN